MKFLLFPMVFSVLTLAAVTSDAVTTNAGSRAIKISNAPVANDPVKKRWASVEVFEDSVKSIYDHINLSKYDLHYDAFRYAMIGYYNLVAEEKIQDKGLLTVIDFTRPSTDKRFYTIDLKAKRVIFNNLVSHGRNTGENLATSFSNKAHSNQSSMGFYVTAETYVGSKGYSLKLDGLDKGYNDNIRSRAVVMHAADYVSDYWIKKYGRLGRSQGCPALPKELNKKVIDTIKEGTLIFAYYNDDNFLDTSTHLQLEKLLEQTLVSDAL